MMYEIMAIIPSKYSDAEVGGVIETVGKLIEATGAKIEKTTNLGKLKLAYPIDHQRYGTYALFYAEMEGSVMAKLDQNLRLADEVLRHMVIARPEGIPAEAFTLVAYQAPLTPEGRRAGDREERPAREGAARSASAPEAGKMTTEELSNKLDKILDTDIMKNV